MKKRLEIVKVFVSEGNQLSRNVPAILSHPTIKDQKKSIETNNNENMYSDEYIDRPSQRKFFESKDFKRRNKGNTHIDNLGGPLRQIDPDKIGPGVFVTNHQKTNMKAKSEGHLLANGYRNNKHANKSPNQMKYNDNSNRKGPINHQEKDLSKNQQHIHENEMYLTKTKLSFEVFSLGKSLDYS